MKIGIIGPKTCQKTKQVKELLFKIKTKFESPIILSGGNETGIESDVKKYALQFGMDYTEFNPSFTGWNQYSGMFEQYYGKQFHISHEPHRYYHLFLESDLIFVGHEPESKDWKMYLHVEKLCKKTGKKIVFI